MTSGPSFHILQPAKEFIHKKHNCGMDFGCIQDCSQCCIEREYFPSKKFGKIGVLILPEEKEKVENLANANKVKISILPRIGISETGQSGPTEIIAYQLMGREENGNTCPFLNTESQDRSPHGGYLCKIYHERPLACMAYPLNGLTPIILDQKCKFCQEHGSADGNLDSETEALLMIKSKMRFSAPVIWRYATNVGEESDRDEIQNGWISE